jgi:hypothetical protein
MTYPQGPYGQQPDPYGQGQQPGQYGQGQQPGQYGGYQTPPGGYQQPPTGQYPGYDQTAQYGGFPGGQYGGGYGGPPPPKKNTGMIVAVVAIVVLVLGGLGITGFVAPGFFLSDKSDNAGGGGGTPTSAENGAAADDFIDELVKAADGKDSAALKDFACSDAESSVQEAIDDIDKISGATLKDTDEKSASKVVATLEITVDGDSADYETTVVKDGKDWCWSDIGVSGGGTGDLPTGSPSEPDDTDTSAPPTGGGSSGSGGEGETFVQGFLDAVNGGDAAGAKTKLCPDSTSQGDVDDAVKGKASLQMDTAGMESQDEYVGVDLKGTLNGAPTSAARTSAFLEDGGWCIFTFYAF